MGTDFFVRTNRRLGEESYRPLVAALLTVVAIFALWGAWSLGTRLPRYVASVRLTVEGGRVVAWFPPPLAGQIQVGSRARLRVGEQLEETVVRQVDIEPGLGRVRVQLDVPPGTTVRDVFVVAGYTSPFKVLTGGSP